jgi:hypothetical protein
MRQCYIHRLKSGNSVAVLFTLPLPTRYETEWLRPATAADLAEYRNELHPVITADLSALDGKPHFMRDEFEPAPRQRKATAAK